MASVQTPWTDEQVQNLKSLQESSLVHPYTCSSATHFEEQKLTPTNNGWVCDNCENTQNWAHDFSLNFNEQDWQFVANLNGVRK